MLKYTENPQNNYIQSSMVTEIQTREKCDFFGVCVLYSICDDILGVSEGWAPSTTIAFPHR